jgi:RNA-directed DNA polymerase
LDKSPTTEDPNGKDDSAANTQPVELQWWSVKSKVKLPVKVAELRRKLYQKAKQEPKFRFYALYDRIYRPDVLTAAWWIVLAKNKSPGIDGVTCQDIMNAPGGVQKYLEDLHHELRTKAYQPDRVKRTYIAKPDGRLRPLGIPTMRDRIVQTAATLVLESIFEADFLDTSFGFRPERSAEQALKAIRGHLDSGYREVYDADLKGYFDTIPHDHLMLALKMRIADNAVLHLIEMWLKCEMVETDENGKATVTRSKTGTPQGGVISPLLSNVYLHWFEKAFHSRTGPAHWAKAKIVRYADDFVILARYQGAQLQGWLEQTLEVRFKLTINREKTKVVKLSQPGSSLDFLGYTFRYDKDLKGRAHRYLNITPSRKAMAKARDALRDLTCPKRCFMPVVAIIAEINQWQTGWTNYFGYGYPRVAFRAIHAFSVVRLTNHLRRRSQRAYRPPVGKSFYAHVHDLGLRRP